MSRQPIVNGDAGSWGTVLNDYLSQSLATDGTILPNAVHTAQLADDSVVMTKLQDFSVSANKLSAGAGSSGQVLSTNGVNLAWSVPSAVPDATATNNGIVRLAGDLAGTASEPTVPGLAEKEPVFAFGTNAEYLRGDKSFQPLDKSAVGLGSVDNTSDNTKPISASVQTALNTKLSTDIVTTKGDLFVATGSATVTRLAAGTDGETLVADSTQAGGIKWAPSSTGQTNVNFDGFLLMGA